MYVRFYFIASCCQRVKNARKYLVKLSKEAIRHSFLFVTQLLVT